MKTLFYLALATGMRKGELLGLKCPIWIRQGILFVSKATSTTPVKDFPWYRPRPRLGAAKSSWVKETLKRLETHSVQQELTKVSVGGRWQENGLIFTTGIGTYLDQTKVSRELRKF